MGEGPGGAGLAGCEGEHLMVRQTTIIRPYLQGRTQRNDGLSEVVIDGSVPPGARDAIYLTEKGGGHTESRRLRLMAFLQILNS